jgi:predicted transglutaminase-like cysteine proteinase
MDLRLTCIIGFLALLTVGARSEPIVAAYQDFPSNSRNGNDQLQFGKPVLPALAHARFCRRYPEDCKAARAPARRGRFLLTNERRASLVVVNASINRLIVPERQSSSPLSEAWIIAPERGDCNDYAVTKRHELLIRGWPSRSLLLAEVVVTTGEHHLVLVVRTRHGDLVLDNLTNAIRHWSATPYEWVKMQSPEDPKMWWTVRGLSS